MMIAHYLGSLASVASVATPFVMLVKTNNAGTSGSTQFQIPTTGTGYNYSVDWGDGTNDTGQTGSITHTYASAGNYVVSISGAFPRIHFANTGDKSKLLEIQQWGSQAWTSLASAFWGCGNLKITASDAPNLSACASMNLAFPICSNIGASTTDFSLWDVSTITDFTDAFSYGTFNGNVSNWNVSAATNMNSMFRSSSLNRSLGNWNINNVTNVRLMLYGTGMSTANYDATLIGWASRSVKPNLTADWLGLTYSSAAVSARATLTGSPNNWNITGDTLV